MNSFVVLNWIILQFLDRLDALKHISKFIPKPETQRPVIAHPLGITSPDRTPLINPGCFGFAHAERINLKLAPLALERDLAFQLVAVASVFDALLLQESAGLAHGESQVTHDADSVIDDRHTVNGLQRCKPKFSRLSPADHQLLFVLECWWCQTRLQITFGKTEHGIHITQFNAVSTDWNQGFF